MSDIEAWEQAKRDAFPYVRFFNDVFANGKDFETGKLEEYCEKYGLFRGENDYDSSSSEIEHEPVLIDGKCYSFTDN